MRLVLDTNVLISAFLWDGNEARLLLECARGRHRAVLSSAILQEVAKVLESKFDCSRAEVASYVAFLERMSDVVDTRTRLEVVRADPTDDRILECAVEGHADAVVTGDRHLLDLGEFRGIRIVRSKEVLREG